MSKMNDTGRVKGRLRPLRALCCFRSFASITRRFSSSLVNQRPARVREFSFLTLARVNRSQVSKQDEASLERQRREPLGGSGGMPPRKF